MSSTSATGPRGGPGPAPRAVAAPRANRGPAAAAANRAALVDAARRLFAEQGIDVPLSAIAREAGVGQGVLYRHFPDRVSLAFTAFEENLTRLEAIAEEGGPTALLTLWRELLNQTVRERAFVELVLGSRAVPEGSDADVRLLRCVEATLPEARRAGVVAADLEVDGVLMAWRMAFGIAATAPDVEAARADLAAVRLLGIPLD